MSRRKHPKHKANNPQEEIAPVTPGDPQQHTCCDQNKAECKYKPAPEERRVLGMTIFERIIALLTLIAASIAAMTGFFIWSQKEEMKIDQRAWVGFTEINDWNLEAGKPFVITVQVKNVGKTPATNVASGFGVTFLPRGTPPPYEDVVNAFMGPPTSLLLPGESHDLKGMIRNRVSGAMPPEDIDKVRSGELVIYAIGKITYNDIFNFSHWTKYCYASNQSSIEVVNFRACRDYNQIDPNGK
jgi:hypothetical protein